MHERSIDVIYISSSVSYPPHPLPPFSLPSLPFLLLSIQKGTRRRSSLYATSSCSNLVLVSSTACLLAACRRCCNTDLYICTYTYVFFMHVCTHAHTCCRKMYMHSSSLYGRTHNKACHTTRWQAPPVCIHKTLKMHASIQGADTSRTSSNCTALKALRTLSEERAFLSS